MVEHGDTGEKWLLLNILISFYILFTLSDEKAPSTFCYGGKKMMKNEKILISAKLYRIPFGLVHPPFYFDFPASTQVFYNTHWQD